MLMSKANCGNHTSVSSLRSCLIVILSFAIAGTVIDVGANCIHVLFPITFGIWNWNSFADCNSSVVLGLERLNCLLSYVDLPVTSAPNILFLFFIPSSLLFL